MCSSLWVLWVIRKIWVIKKICQETTFSTWCAHSRKSEINSYRVVCRQWHYFAYVLRQRVVYEFYRTWRDQVWNQQFYFDKGRKWCKFHLNFVYIARGISNGFTVFFDAKSAIIINARGWVILKVLKRNNLLTIEGEKNVCDMKRYDNGTTGEHADKCKTCMYSKIHAQLFPQEIFERTEDLLILKNMSNHLLTKHNNQTIIHSDVCDPSNVKSCCGARYFVAFIDDSSRRIFVYFLKAKSEVFESVAKW